MNPFAKRTAKSIFKPFLSIIEDRVNKKNFNVIKKTISLLITPPKKVVKKPKSKPAVVKKPKSKPAIIKPNSNIMDDIEWFFTKSKKEYNGPVNNIREGILLSIFNGSWIDNGFMVNEQWKMIANGAREAIESRLGPIETCILKGGRRNKHDFEINGFRVEFKYGSTIIDNLPQFLNQNKPSTFLTYEFEEFCYDNLMPKASAITNFPMPIHEEYIKQIHGNTPKCMMIYKEIMHRKESTNPILMNKIDGYRKQTIMDFVSKYDIKYKEFSDHLLKTQVGKIYLLCVEGKFYIDELKRDDLVFIGSAKYKNGYYLISKNNTYMEALLRFKNMCSFVHPALQVSYKGKINGNIIRKFNRVKSVVPKI